MARKPHMPYHQLLDLARQMLNEGESLTSVTLQRRAGGGSYSTTKRAVDEVLSECGLTPGAQPDAAADREEETAEMPQPLQDAITRLTMVVTQQFAAIRRDEAAQTRRLLDTTQAEHAATVQALRKQLEERNAEIQELASAADQATEEIDVARDQLEVLGAQLAQARRDMSAAREEIVGLRAQLDARHGIEVLQARIDELQEAIAKARPKPKTESKKS